MCELTHGMGAAWARHAMCESAFTVYAVAVWLVDKHTAASIRYMKQSPSSITDIG
jgi:hypothetical protein